MNRITKRSKDPRTHRTQGFKHPQSKDPRTQGPKDPGPAAEAGAAIVTQQQQQKKQKRQQQQQQQRRRQQQQPLPPIVVLCFPAATLLSLPRYLSVRHARGCGN